MSKKLSSQGSHQMIYRQNVDRKKRRQTKRRMGNKNEGNNVKSYKHLMGHNV